MNSTPIFHPDKSPDDFWHRLPVLLTKRQCGAITGFSNPTIDRKRQAGTFIEPEVVDGNFLRFNRDTLRGWLEERQRNPGKWLEDRAKERAHRKSQRIA